MCVYVCASKPVPNESFTGSSTSGHSSTLRKKLGVCFCVCKCMNVYLCTERQKYTSIDFVSSYCLSCLKRMTIHYWESQRTNQSTSVFFTNSYMLRKLISGQPQLSVSVSYQTPKFPWHPWLPLPIWNRYTPTLWVSFPGQWIVNDLCCHAVWLHKNHIPWREREREREG